MKEILITSSVLILALLLLREAFRKALSRRVQYALWGLVALRLLLPVNLPAAGFSVLTAAEPMRQAVEELPISTADPSAAEDDRMIAADGQIPTSAGDAAPNLKDDSTVKHGGEMNTGRFLRRVWYIGIALMAAWFLLANLRFYLRLRKYRTPFAAEGAKRPVWLVGEGILPSPCLFGGAVYLTPAAVAEPGRLRHVLAHEETHARHLDPLWSLLRCVCLALYWFDPLVWVAALASRTDCELACDEGALRRLGEAERIPYGETLLKLIPVRGRPGNPLLTATTMTAGKRRLKERITRIAEKRKTHLAAVVAVLALAAILAAVTFTGAKRRQAEEAAALTAEELEQFEELLFSREDAMLRGQFLTCAYDAPENIDLFQLFYNGTGQPGSIGMEERQAVADADYGGEDPEVDLIKCPASEMEAVLNRYANTTLREGGGRTPSNKPGLEAFTYLPDYDAYYHFHGDTNAMGPVTFLAGEREGNFVRLYYNSPGLWLGLNSGYRDGPACLTLEEYPGEAVDGFSWYFVSNLLTERSGGMTPVSVPAPEEAYIPAAELPAAVPDEVRRHAESFAAAAFDNAAADEYYAPFAFDGWRVQALSCAYIYENCHGMDVGVYRMNYEFHSARPEEAEARLAGGMYVTEDGWVCTTYPDSTWLFFREDKPDILLFSLMINDSLPGESGFTSDMEHAFFKHPELLPEGSAELAPHTRADYDAAIREAVRCLDELGAHPNTTSLRIQSLAVDEAESRRVLNPWAAAPLAEESELKSEQARKMLAVQAVYDVQWLPAVEAMGEESGLTVEYFYLLPDENGEWYVWDRRSLPAGTPPEEAQSVEPPVEPAAPAERDGFDEAGIANAVNGQIAAWRALPGVTTLDVLHSGVDEAETARIVARYAGSEMAAKQGWTEAYVARMTAAAVVVEVQLDPAAMSADTASLNWNDGVNACYLYVLPPEGSSPEEHVNEGWYVWTMTGCAVPEGYQNGAAGLPGGQSTQTRLVQYASFEEAYAKEITQRQEQSPDSFRLLDTLDAGKCTVVSCAGDSPRGVSGSLVALHDDGSAVYLPLPPRTVMGESNPAESLALSEDGTAVIYTVSYPELVMRTDRREVVHRRGTYRYTYDIAARTLSLEIRQK